MRQNFHDMVRLINRQSQHEMNPATKTRSDNQPVIVRSNDLQRLFSIACIDSILIIAGHSEVEIPPRSPRRMPYQPP